MMKNRVAVIVFFVSLTMMFGHAPATVRSWAAVPVDHSIYAGLLAKHVVAGVVDYQGFKNDESRLDEYLKILEEVKSVDLSRNEQFAFFINAYNAWTIKLILTGYPGINSIKDLGGLLKGPWKMKIARIDGKILTLDDIEHKILRPRFQDPRVHFAVNCASKGCPPLLSIPYQGSILEIQLDEVTRRFIHDPTRNRLADRTLYVSRIFKWFSKDFDNDVVGFFLQYAEGNLKERLIREKGKIKLKYLDYDWSLNGH
jgi:hypothetical protein